MLTAALTFAVAGALIVLLPGPDTLVVVRALIRQGRRRAVSVVAGVLSGLMIWVTGAALGLSALLRASHDGYTALRVAGAIYLLWLGIQSIRQRGSAFDIAEPSGTGVRPRRSALLGSGYFAGLATDVLNPKVGVFFVTFLPGFVPHGASVGLTSMLLGAIFIAETALYFVVLLLIAGRITTWLHNQRIRRRLERLTGTVLVGFGIRLALET